MCGPLVIAGGLGPRDQPEASYEGAVVMRMLPPRAQELMDRFRLYDDKFLRMQATHRKRLPAVDVLFTVRRTRNSWWAEVAVPTRGQLRGSGCHADAPTAGTVADGPVQSWTV